MSHRIIATACLAACLSCSATAEEAPVDLLTFAQGVLPISIDMGGADLRTGQEQALLLIDGNPLGRTITPRFGDAETRVEFLFELPAPTVFSRLAVPAISETPSPSQTFFREVAVQGSLDGPEGPFQEIGAGTLAVHEAESDETDLTLVSDPPKVRWVKVALSGGIDVQRDQTFFEFSEIIGEGVQDAAPFSDRFTGVWKGRGVNIELMQDGATVNGCYDRGSELTGTVDGNVLRALGFDPADIASQFILIADETGTLRGLRSTNGAPFTAYDGEASDDPPTCLPQEEPTLGCGDIVHGIGFDFDSDVIRPTSAPILEAIHAGLAAETAASIEIVGHSSSEGAEAYNLDLSERRAQSVVAALAGLGLDPARLSASGRGEAEPIASNDDEAGRSLNRRVEIVCSG